MALASQESDLQLNRLLMRRSEAFFRGLLWLVVVYSFAV